MNQLATLLGTTPPTLKRIESGQATPKADVLTNLFTLTGWPPEKWLDNSIDLPESVTIAASSIVRNVPNPHDYQREQAAWRDFINKLIVTLADGNQQTFAAMVGLDNPFLNKMLNGRQTITKATMYRIGKYTGRYDWLPAGERPGAATATNTGPVHEGQALKKYLDERNIKQTELARMINKNKATVTMYIQNEKLQDRTWNSITDALGVSYEQIVGAPSTDNPDSSRFVGPSMKPYYSPQESPDDYISLMLLPVKFRAGFNFTSYHEGQGQEERVDVPKEYLERLARIVDVKRRAEETSKYMVVVVDGDSMEPRLEAGYKVLAYRLDPSTWDYQSSGIFGVEFGDQFVIKRIKDNTLMDNELLVLHSDNPDGGKLSVPRSEIRNIWKIERIIDGRL
ncbi:helix-turn-helix domain-containing protein [Larkinella knui]|uniref:Helix-turn-helix domain-containing protein n=1 Tax=Larkinella knui TaxID=2025310 RepID=A0A3P1CJ83_9BACT|nr:helix-turn-helix domain-containing protein [Larkinella knui]RRB13411.1 helix-turn-helix domain-containing protein [Larkinella knui]